MSSKASRKASASRRIKESNVSTTKALSKSPSDASHMLADASSYDAGPPLHFYGLAVTQTQTQVASGTEASRDGDERSEGRVCIHSFPMLSGCFTLLISTPVDDY